MRFSIVWLFFYDIAKLSFVYVQLRWTGVPHPKEKELSERKSQQGILGDWENKTT